MVPHTTDGRVMFAIPWHGHTLVGTTDTPIDDADARAAAACESEIEFILETAGRYLHKAPTRDDVLSVFAGIRPLVKSGDGRLTAALSRDHTIHIDPSGLLTIDRRQVDDLPQHGRAHRRSGRRRSRRLAERPCVTRTLNDPRIPRQRGAVRRAERLRIGRAGDPGSDARDTVDWRRRSTRSCRTPAPKSSGRRVTRWRERSKTCSPAARGRCSSTHARRCDGARAAALLARELGRDADWERAQIGLFETLARRYMVST